jgi:hypothetical protein
MCSGAAIVEIGSATHHCTNLAFSESQIVTGSSLSAIGVGDFDADGALDLVVTSWMSAQARVLLGRGDGSFEMGSTTATGAQPMSLAVADFDADGRLDVAVANQLSKNVSVLHGNGDGTFVTARVIPLESAPAALLASDVNGDGAPDLLVALPDTEHVAVALVRCDGNIAKPVSYDAGAVIALATTDLDADGSLDIVAVDWRSGPTAESQLAVLPGHGDGTFGTMTSHPIDRGEAVVAGDFNRDGRVDVAVATSPDGTIGGLALLLWGNGDGTFTNGPSYGIPKDANRIQAADMDADGISDLVVASTGNFSVLPSLGDGTLPANARLRPRARAGFRGRRFQRRWPSRCCDCWTRGSRPRHVEEHVRAVMLKSP